MHPDIQPILDKALAGERLSSDDCTALLESPDFVRIGLAADEIRQRQNDPSIVTYIIDRNINYTNVCNVVCTFCAFYRRPGAPDTYVRSFEEICDGKWDHLPEQAFMYVGGIEEAAEQAAAMAKA